MAELGINNPAQTQQFEPGMEEGPPDPMAAFEMMSPDEHRVAAGISVANNDHAMAVAHTEAKQRKEAELAGVPEVDVDIGVPNIADAPVLGAAETAPQPVESTQIQSGMEPPVVEPPVDTRTPAQVVMDEEAELQRQQDEIAVDPYGFEEEQALRQAQILSKSEEDKSAIEAEYKAKVADAEARFAERSAAFPVEYEQKFAAFQARQDQIDQILGDPKRLAGEASPLQSILGVISAALGGYVGLHGANNPGVRALENVIQRDAQAKMDQLRGLQAASAQDKEILDGMTKQWSNEESQHQAILTSLHGSWAKELNLRAQQTTSMLQKQEYLRGAARIEQGKLEAAQKLRLAEERQAAMEANRALNAEMGLARIEQQAKTKMAEAAAKDEEKMVHFNGEPIGLATNSGNQKAAQLITTKYSEFSTTAKTLIEQLESFKGRKFKTANQWLQFAESEEGGRIRSLFARLSNKLIKSESGQAVSGQEMKRMMAQLSSPSGLFSGADPDIYLRNLKAYAEDERQAVTNQLKGYTGQRSIRLGDPWQMRKGQDEETSPIGPSTRVKVLSEPGNANPVSPISGQPVSRPTAPPVDQPSSKNIPGTKPFTYSKGFADSKDLIDANKAENLGVVKKGEPSYKEASAALSMAGQKERMKGVANLLATNPSDEKLDQIIRTGVIGKGLDKLDPVSRAAIVWEHSRLSGKNPRRAISAAEQVIPELQDLFKKIGPQDYSKKNPREHNAEIDDALRGLPPDMREYLLERAEWK